MQILSVVRDPSRRRSNLVRIVRGRQDIFMPNMTVSATGRTVDV